MGQERRLEKVLTLDDGYQLEYTVIELNNGHRQKPLLLFIVGSSGLGAFYYHLAVRLSESFTCVYYDRRGFRSTQSTPTLTAADDKNKDPSSAMTVTRHAADAARLITHLTGSQTEQDGRLLAGGGERGGGAYVFATSFGATVALCLVLEHPKLVRKAILHEPMLPTLLPKGQERDRSFAGFRAVSNAEAPFTVFSHRFLSVNGDASSATDTTPTPSSSSNSATPKENAFWSGGSPGNLKQARSESLAAIDYHPDPAQLAAASEKLAVAAGLESKRLPMYGMSQALVQAIPSLRGGIQDFAGGHFTFVSRKHIGEICAKIKWIFRGPVSDANYDDGAMGDGGKAKM